MANSKEMTRGAVFPLLFSFTMPLLLGNLLQQTYSLIDAAIVGKFGSPDKPGGLSIQLCKSEKKEFYIRYSS